MDIFFLSRGNSFSIFAIDKCNYHLVSFTLSVAHNDLIFLELDSNHIKNTKNVKKLSSWKYKFFDTFFIIEITANASNLVTGNYW